jgi:hypothetical protein
MPTVLYVIILVIIFLIAGGLLSIFPFGNDHYFLGVLTILFGGSLAIAPILAINFFLAPAKENRFVPDTKIVASYNGADTADLYWLEAEEPFFLQIRIAVKSRSSARRLFGDNKIPFVVEISNPDIADFVIQKAEGFEETKPPETGPDKTVFFLTVLADRKPAEALINLKGIGKKPGEQQIKLVFSEKVSGKYSKLDTLRYLAPEDLYNFEGMSE